MKKLNNRGFTLVELLAVIVILITIMSIAIPTISSSLERSKDKQNKAKKDNIKAAAELYITDNKNAVFSTLTSIEEGKEKKCYIELTQLLGYLDADDLNDADDKEFNEVITYDGTTIDFLEKNEGTTVGLSVCVNAG